MPRKDRSRDARRDDAMTARTNQLKQPPSSGKLAPFFYDKGLLPKKPPRAERKETP